MLRQHGNSFLHPLQQNLDFASCIARSSKDNTSLWHIPLLPPPKQLPSHFTHTICVASLFRPSSALFTKSSSRWISGVTGERERAWREQHMYVRVFDNRGKGGQNEYIHQSLMRIRHMHIAGGCFFSFSRRAARWILHLCSRFFCRVPYHSLCISKCVCAPLHREPRIVLSLFTGAQVRRSR